MGNEIKKDIPIGQDEDITKKDLHQTSYLLDYSTEPLPRGREEHGKAADNPTYSITWVETDKKLEFGIDYLSLTIYGSYGQSLSLYNRYFENILGRLKETGGSRFYERQFIAEGGFYLQTQPRIRSNKEHFRMIFPGEACGYIDFETFRKMKIELDKREIEIHCTRLDMRIDNCPFTPLQAANDIKNGKARTHANRSTIKIFEQPLEIDEKGGIGTQGMYLGSRTSERYLRIYDLHGFTRFELECKENYADAYLNSLILQNIRFQDLMMGYCMDFIDIDADYWREFTDGYARERSSPKICKDKTIEGFKSFLMDQCSAIFSIIHDIEGETFINDLLARGRQSRKRYSKYSVICHKYGIDERIES